jgi:hypothetical protein
MILGVLIIMLICVGLRTLIEYERINNELD